MNRESVKAAFSTLSQTNKAVVLLGVMHELTLTVRQINQSFPRDCETRSRLMYAISELNHRLIAAASALIEDRQTFPDEVLVDMLFDGPNQPELASQFPYVLMRAMQSLGNSS